MNKKKVLVVGAGVQGGACASILARDKDISEVVLADLDIDLANKVKTKIKSSKLNTMKVDAGKIEDIEKAAKGVDAIINLTLTAFDSNIMQAALRCGAHYVDTSFGEGSFSDIWATDNILAQMIEKRPLRLGKEFKEAGLTALLGCGASPGVFNVLARYVCDKLDTVDGIRLRFGRKPLVSSPEVVKGWTPTWSPFRALWGYAVEPTIFEDGEYRKYPIYSKCENYDFPDPVGTIPLVYHQHQEPISLPYFIGKGIKYCDFKYTVDREVGALIKTGFASSEPVEVKGVKIAPRDVLLKLVPRPGDTFLTENEKTARLPLTVAACGVIEVTGTKSGKKMEYKISFVPPLYSTPEERLEIYRKFGATNIYVCLPAIVGAKMCMAGDAEKGVIGSECLEPIKFLEMMAQSGWPLKFAETCSKEVCITP